MSKDHHNDPLNVPDFDPVQQQPYRYDHATETVIGAGTRDRYTREQIRHREAHVPEAAARCYLTKRVGITDEEIERRGGVGNVMALLMGGVRV